MPLTSPPVIVTPKGKVYPPLGTRVVMGGYCDPLAGKDYSMLGKDDELKEDDLSAQTMSFCVAPLHTQKFLIPVSITPKQMGEGVPIPQ